MARLTAWSNTSYAIVTLFITCFLLLGLVNQAEVGLRLRPTKKYDFPDFEAIHHYRTLTESIVNLEKDDRIIVIGDVHGMNHSLHDLLSKLSYKPEHDVLLFAGDLLAKSTQSGSLSTLDFLIRNQNITTPVSQNTQIERIFAVRGNHDQLVVQWRAWRDWFEKITLPTPSSGDAANSSGQVARSGREFLKFLEAEWANEKMKEEPDPEEWVDVARKRARGTWKEEWWRRIPPPGKGKHRQEWKMFGDHYWLARDMSPEHASFLLSLPLVHHVPSMHLFVVHAGLLPSDPRLPPTDQRQPLARLPKRRESRVDEPFDSEVDEDEDSTGFSSLSMDFLSHALQDVLISSPKLDSSSMQSLARRDESEEELRVLQENSLLHDVPQNRDPWVLLNMRGVKKGKITRVSEEGTPWSKIWNKQMKRCAGYSKTLPLADDDGDDDGDDRDDDEDEDDEDDTYSLTCRPSTVLYGHAASRDLDIKRWSMGLDTGCLYGRRLTALVLTQSSNHQSADSVDDFEDDDTFGSEHPDGLDHLNVKLARSKDHIRFGDRDSSIHAKLVNVKCKPVD